MEIENTTEHNQKKNKGGFFTFLLGLLSVLILFGTLGGVAYYYFVFKKKDLSSVEEIEIDVAQIETKDVNELINQIKTKNHQIKILKDENTLLKEQAKSMTGRLSYAIKPKSQYVGECYNAKLGEWRLPSSCIQNLKVNLEALLQSDKRVLVLEVIGVVDERQYSGKFPELKQEGLASFRAREVINFLRKNFPTVTTFEGLSMQEERKRGFAVRAYYMQ